MDESERKESLEAYSQACARWFEWLDDDSEASITGQLSQLFWHDAVFRALNEARSLASKENPTAVLSPYLTRFIDQGYVTGQVIGISKLVERHHGDANKGVISLRRLVDDLKAHQHLLTRANYLGRDNYPYDYEPVKRAALEAMFEGAKEGVIYWRGETEGAAAWDTSERLHRQFDQLAGVAEADRKPEDQVSDTALEKLSNALDDDVFTLFLTVRHKAVAHAADAVSRSKAAAKDRRGIKFEEVDRAHQLLVGVSQVISATILHGKWRGVAVPVAQQNPFEYVELPFVPEGGMGYLQGFWREGEKRRDEWLHKAWEELMP